MLELITAIGVWLAVLELVDINSKLFNINSKLFNIQSKVYDIKNILKRKEDKNGLL